MPNRLRALFRFLAQTLPAWFRAVLVLAVLSCQAASESDSQEEHPKLGSVSQAITDTDGDGMDDGWETTYFGSLSQTASGDFDSDGMTNLEEYTNGFNPTVADAFADLDQDRYPNIFELRNSSNPNDAGSIPSPTYTVNGAGGGTHTTIGAAVARARMSRTAVIKSSELRRRVSLHRTSEQPRCHADDREAAAPAHRSPGSGEDDYPGRSLWLRLAHRERRGRCIVDVSERCRRTLRRRAVEGGSLRRPRRARQHRPIRVGWRRFHVNNAAKVYIAGSTFTNNLARRRRMVHLVQRRCRHHHEHGRLERHGRHQRGEQHGRGRDADHQLLLREGTDAHRNRQPRGNHGPEAPVRPSIFPGIRQLGGGWRRR